MINFLTPFLGYLAFLFLAISLLVNNDLKFRWINSFGNLSFVLYGIFIHAFPIVLTNAVLLLINIYFLFKIYWRQEKFDIIEFNKDAALIPAFLSFYQKDIHAYFPDFVLEDKQEEIKFVVLRDIVIANLFVAHVDTRGNAFVKINYTVPKYRDFKIGRFLFDEGRSFLQAKGIERIIYKKVDNRNHEKFIQAIGFNKEIPGSGNCYTKII